MGPDGFSGVGMGPGANGDDVAAADRFSGRRRSEGSGCYKGFGRGERKGREIEVRFGWRGEVEDARETEAEVEREET